MPVQLRERKRVPAATAPLPPPKKRKPTKSAEAKAVEQKPQAKDDEPGPVEKEPEAPESSEKQEALSKTLEPLAVGDSVSLDGFGGEIETNDGQKTTLADLAAKSKSGVVLFTYPKASTPGCMAI